MDIKVDNKTVIVFDLDDTLYNEMEYLRSAYGEIAKTLQPNDWQSLFARMYSLFRSKEDVFEFVASNYDVKKTSLLKQYRRHKPVIHLFEGVLDTFKQIKAKSGKLGIITDGRSSTQRAKLEALGLTKLVDIIIISEEIGTEKPNENNYIAVEKAFKNHSYLYMADNLRKDFISPNTRGWRSLGLIDNGLNMHYDAHKYFEKNRMPQNFVSSFKEINII